MYKIVVNAETGGFETVEMGVQEKADFQESQRPIQESIRSAIGAYRDQKIVKVINVNGFLVKNTDRTRQALLQKISSMQLSGALSVNFKTEYGFMDIGYEDILGLFKSCDEWQQKCFNAAKFVTEQSYENIEDAYEDFDNFINSSPEDL